MKQERGVLLASFIKAEEEDAVLAEVEFIASHINLTNKFIFLLEDNDDPTNKILSYNAIVSKNRVYNPRLYTIRVHRKKQTNTLYTINALNKAVALEHNGETGKHLKLDWEKYTDSILLTSGSDLKVHNVTVAKIFEVEEEEPAPAE
jgi:hypothetical protein